MKKVQKTTNNKSILHKLSCVMTVFMLIQIIAVYSPVMASSPIGGDKAMVAIMGTKKVTSNDAPSGETFRFKLTQVADSTGNTYGGSPLSDTATVTTNGPGEYDFTFDLELPNGTYYFKIAEIDDSVPGWNYSTESYIIEVVVSHGIVTMNDMTNSRPLLNGDENDLTWISPGIHDNLPWGSANYFSVLTFEDFTVGGADVEGGLAVGGNLESKGGYSLGKPYNYTGHLIPPHNPRLLVQKNIKIGQGMEVWGGSIVVSDNPLPSITCGTYIRSIKYTGSSPYYNTDATSTGFASAVDLPDSVEKESSAIISTFFDAAKKDLKALSKYYYSEEFFQKSGVKVIDLATEYQKHPGYINDTVANYVTILYLDNTSGKGVFPTDYASYHTIVYNLTLNDFNANQAEIWSTYFTIPVDYLGKIIINVLPGISKSGGITTQKLHINNGATYINSNKDVYPISREYADRIIWNFPSDQLTEISTYGHQIIGSVLAPYAAFKPNGGGVNGTLVAKSVNATGADGISNSGWETHSTTLFGRVQFNNTKIEFTNTYGTEPEPELNSITVHKYIMDSLDSTGVHGDGSKLDDNQLPDGATKLSGIPFTLYSVDFTNGKSTPINYEDYRVDTSTSPPKLYSPSLDTTSYTLNQVGLTVKTNSEGVVTFDNLPNGCYVVVEESDPHGRVTAAILPFIVQLPLYNETNKDGLNHVHVYPKNQGKPGGDKFPDTGGIGSVIFTVTGVVMLSGSLVALTLADKKSKSARVKK